MSPRDSILSLQMQFLSFLRKPAHVASRRCGMTVVYELRNLWRTPSDLLTLCLTATSTGTAYDISILPKCAPANVSASLDDTRAQTFHREAEKHKRYHDRLATIGPAQRLLTFRTHHFGVSGTMQRKLEQSTVFARQAHTPMQLRLESYTPISQLPFTLPPLCLSMSRNAALNPTSSF